MRLQPHRHRLAAGEAGGDLVDRVGRVGYENDPAVAMRVDDRLVDQVDGLLRTVRRQDVHLGIELHAETARAPAGDRGAQRRGARGRRVAASRRHRVEQPLADACRSLLVRIADGEVDDPYPLGPGRRLGLVEADERVRGQRRKSRVTGFASRCACHDPSAMRPLIPAARWTTGLCWPAATAGASGGLPKAANHGRMSSGVSGRVGGAAERTGCRSGPKRSCSRVYGRSHALPNVT